MHPGATYWTNAAIDPEPPWWSHLYVSEIEWSHGILDDLLRLVADDKISNVAVVDPDVRWLYHPYDGGMDVILPSPVERDTLRDTLRDRHRDWLSDHPRGLYSRSLPPLPTEAISLGGCRVRESVAIPELRTGAVRVA